MGANKISLRSIDRRRSAEASVRPFLYQKPGIDSGCNHCVRDSQDNSVWAWGPMRVKGLEVEMKNNRRVTLATAVMVFAMSISVAAQTPSDPQKARPRTTTSGEEKNNAPVVGDKVEPAETSRTPAYVADDSKANGEGEQDVYANFFSTYRLGPEDVISVEVFNQDRYSRKGIIIPPSGRVSLSLIPGGVFVNG